MSIDEYLEMEEKSETRHEYHNGEVFDMAGGTVAHALICMNFNGTVRATIISKGLACNTFGSDLKIYIEPYQSFL